MPVTVTELRHLCAKQNNKILDFHASAGAKTFWVGNIYKYCKQQTARCVCHDPALDQRGPIIMQTLNPIK